MITEKIWLEALEKIPDNWESISEFKTTAGAFADWLDEKGNSLGQTIRTILQDERYDFRNLVLDSIISPELMGSDWKEAFAFAGKESGCNTEKPEKALPNDDISTEPFGREDIERIIAKSEGIHDEKDWLVAGQLKDGRFFFLSAGCDYTGWD